MIQISQLLEKAKENYQISGFIISVLISFPLIAVNPSWYGVVLFRDIDLGIGLFFGLLFALKFRDPDESPLKFGLKEGITAGILSSIIPGAGYLYCNRKRTGITSFIVNGLLFWTIRDAIIKKQYGFATTACFFGIGWYIGNIKGSVDAAKAHNAHVRKESINSMLEKENLYEYVKN